MDRFNLSQVERITGVSANKVAYWLEEFPELQTLTYGGESGEVLLDYEALGLVLRIQLLLEEVGLTIAGARRQIELDETSEPDPGELRERLLRIRQELVQVRQILEG
ncbi:MerR family transcriptional regulator [bacterium]|nr:MerR family transcriptional regulator [bacterium]